MRIEDKIRIDSLKVAAIVMGNLADSFKDKTTRDETKSLAWSISWAVIELTKLMENSEDESCIHY